MKILCIDICQIQLSALRGILSRHGYEAHFASNGVCALSKIIESRGAFYDAVIADMDMPVIDGELLASILLMANYPARIILYYKSRDLSSRGPFSRSVSYIPKGDYQQILRRLEQIRQGSSC